MPCFHSRRDPNRSLKATTREMTNDPYIGTIQKPNTPPIDPNKLKGISVTFFIGNARSCSDLNLYVDYIIMWLQEDNIRVEKLSIRSPLAIKLNITSSPVAIIFSGREIKYKLNIQSIVNSYKQIKMYLASL